MISTPSYVDGLFKFSTATMTWTQLDTVAVVMGTAPSGLASGVTAVGGDIYVGELRKAEGRIGHAWLPCCVCHQSAGVRG